MDFSYLTSAELTDTGRQRSHNEDAVLRLPEYGVFCVADGLGGAFGGEIASRIAVDSIRDSLVPAPAGAEPSSLTDRISAMVAALDHAGGLIRREAEQAGASHCATTVVVALFSSRDPSKAAVLHAGDSRAYRFRKGELQQLTRDHSVAAAMGIEDEDETPAVIRGLVTRAVGVAGRGPLEQTAVDVAGGDLYLLCTDGLTAMLKDAALGAFLQKSSSGELSSIAARLVHLANKAGGADNISVVLIRADETLPPAATCAEDEVANRDTPAGATR